MESFDDLNDNRLSSKYSKKWRAIKAQNKGEKEILTLEFSMYFPINSIHLHHFS